ncbi:MAG: DNA polymerase III subunit epsilon [Sinobacterium sp.]|nr:DNA polymerase III subunit epsilon [Sinobacterium sp.]
MTRQIFLDTETTGINYKEGHRLIEIGCVEMIDRKPTGNTYHQYIYPERLVEEGALAIHGITDDFLKDKPLFSQVADEFCQFVDGAELVIHNAPFDLGFLNHELAMIGSPFGTVESHCGVIDTLVMARAMNPGGRNSLDALCRRYGIDNSHRVLHGALLDAEILADVYLLMTGGQKGLDLEGEEGGENDSAFSLKVPEDLPLKVLLASAEEQAEHSSYIEFINKKSSGESLFK